MKRKRTYIKAFIEDNFSENELNSWKKLYGQYYNDIKVVIVLTILSYLCEQGPDGLTKHEVIRDDDAECIRDIWSVGITGELYKYIRESFPDKFRVMGIKANPDSLENILREFLNLTSATDFEGEIISLHEGRTAYDFTLRLLPTGEDTVISGYIKGMHSYLTIHSKV